MTLRAAATLAVMLLLAVSGCANDTESPPSPDTPAPSGTTSAKEMDAGMAQRLDATIEQAMTAAKIPGVIVGVLGTRRRHDMSGRSGWRTRPPARR